MENNDASACVALASPPAARDIASRLTLFEIEESIALLAEAAEEEGMTPDIEQALTTYLQRALEFEAVARGFLLARENQQGRRC